MHGLEKMLIDAYKFAARLTTTLKASARRGPRIAAAMSAPTVRAEPAKLIQTHRHGSSRKALLCRRIRQLNFVKSANISLYPNVCAVCTMFCTIFSSRYNGS